MLISNLHLKIVAEFENEDDAYRLEAELIFKYGTIRSRYRHIAELVDGVKRERSWSWIEEIARKKQ